MVFFWQIFDEVWFEYFDMFVSYNYVDVQVFDFVCKFWDFDVLVMENMFGDIFFDLVGGLVGGMGMVVCVEIGDQIGLFQFVYGSVLDIMG